MCTRLFLKASVSEVVSNSRPVTHLHDQPVSVTCGAILSFSSCHALLRHWHTGVVVSASAEGCSCHVLRVTTASHSCALLPVHVLRVAGSPVPYPCTVAAASPNPDELAILPSPRCGRCFLSLVLNVVVATGFVSSSRCLLAKSGAAGLH